MIYDAFFHDVKGVTGLSVIFHAEGSEVSQEEFVVVVGKGSFAYFNGLKVE